MTLLSKLIGDTKKARLRAPMLRRLNINKLAASAVEYHLILHKAAQTSDAQI
jgi:hypothetical protein